MFSSGTCKFLIGVAVGAAAVTLVRTQAFRKGCAKLVSAGMQLKEDASEFVESLKEDAEDIKAEAASKAKAAKA